MIFVDSNIPMYLIGASHPHKTDAQLMLEGCFMKRRSLVTDAEVFQEILHRFVAINRLDGIGPAFEVLSESVDEVFPITHSDVCSAREILAGSPFLSARDAIHLAIMEHHGVRSIMTFDRSFDRFPQVSRIRTPDDI